jgi:hypothetical protein
VPVLCRQGREQGTPGPPVASWLGQAVRACPYRWPARGLARDVCLASVVSRPNPSHPSSYTPLNAAILLPRHFVDRVVLSQPFEESDS